MSAAGAAHGGEGSGPVERYIPAPVACERLDAMVRKWNGSVVVRAEEMRVNYALPRHATLELQDFFRAQAMVEFGPAYVARLPGGRVFGSGNVLSPDGRAIARDVSLDFGKAFEEHWLLTYKKIPPPIPIRGRTAVIATTLGAGYSHWLLEELPRLLALDPGDCETLIAHAGHVFSREAITLHGFSGKVIEARRSAHAICEELVVPTPGWLTPATVKALEAFVTPLRQPFSLGERIYISREKARRRRVTNEQALWAALEARGFVEVHLEELTWREQINVFRAAKEIVAPHGAGLANLVFCEPGIKVVELFHRPYVNGCYWQLAVLKSLDYCPVVVSSGEPLAQRQQANRLDIEADISQVLEALRG